jgi:HD-GYP domain-containing protein (c-di-GMP phosphodiesterase class II)
VETLESKIVKYGKSLITNLYILVRITGIYDSMNEAILNTAKRLLADLKMLVEETGEISIKIIEGTFYIEGIRIKATVSDIENFTSLADEFKKRLIGSLDFKAPLQTDDLIHLAYAIKGGTEASEIQAGIESKLTKGIIIGGPVFLQKEEEIDLKDSQAVAKRAYLKAVAVMKEMEKALKEGKRFQLKKIKRALQLIVDAVLADDSYLIAFTAVRNYENYHYFHPVNVSILSAALGKRLGIERVDLRTLAMTAFFHDIGKIEIPLSILNKKTEPSPKERELISRHPLDGIKVFLRSLGLNEASILSMLVCYEHHMRADLSGYPKTSAGRRLNIFSRIVSITDDYDSFVSGRVYSRKRFSPEKTLNMMIKDSGTRYDPLLMKAFSAMFI